MSEVGQNDGKTVKLKCGQSTGQDSWFPEAGQGSISGASKRFILVKILMVIRPAVGLHVPLC